MSTGGNLRQARLSRGLTQSQAGEEIGLTRQAISSYEADRTRPDIETVTVLAQMYKVTLEGLIYGSGRELRGRRTVKIAAWVLRYCLSPDGGG